MASQQGRRAKPYGKVWLERALDVSGYHCFIEPCEKCDQPVSQGYVCIWCGDGRHPADEKEAP